MTTSQAFRPDWASPPGETIAEVLAERDISVAEFARRIEQSPDQVEDLLVGRSPVTLALARRLADVLGATREFWMSRDFQYRDDAARQNVEGQDWLARFPVSDFVKFGWLKLRSSPVDVGALLQFFGTPSVGAWRDAYGGLEQQVAFRTSEAFGSNPAAVAAWLRQGEREAAAIRCAPWDADRFRAALADIRGLTKLKDPAHFLPRLRDLCAACGVAVVVVRAPAGCRASGATRFLSPDKALLMLSFRYRSDDHLWFTFFHEAGHLLLHGDRGLILEGDDEDGDDSAATGGRRTSTEELEANDFAARTLIPPEFQPALRALGANHKEVMRFATQVGVSSGVVVGQLQHLGLIPRSHLNKLKRRFDWDG